jgi:serine/threonine-protein kinase RsbW
MAANTSTESGLARVARVTLRFAATLEYRPIAIDLVSALIENVEGADRDFRHEMVTAFGEAFNNIVIHGYGDRLDGMLDVEAEMAADRMTLHLRDTGREVDFGDVEPPDLVAMPERGMGVFMIHALVDEVRYVGGSPNVLSLTKRTTCGRGGPDEVHAL